MDWRDEHDGLLKARLANGESFSVVADALNATFGSHFSRCAVAGRVKRLGLNACNDAEKHGRDTAARVAGFRKHLKEIEVSRESCIAPSREIRDGAAGNAKDRAEVRSTTPKKIPLVYLKHFHCRCVVAEKDGKALFCGLTKQKGSAWCPMHHARFVQRRKDDA